ncbi:unnamed protein product [Staurois parvus]|uniref:Uncharacterized protein n=1 Tax=Staurois parvus TaxID=386267 RepID=A0ABN9G9Q7_9NEOB|nr:unnamed protein product [Staurois parvus]
MSHCGPSSSVTRGGTGAHGRFGAWQHLWEACNLPATYDKMETSRSVRRPESGTWQSVGAMAMGGGTGTHDTHCGPSSSSNGRRYRDPCHTVDPAAA